MYIKTTMRYHLRSVRMAVIKKNTNKRCWQRCGKKGNLYPGQEVTVRTGHGTTDWFHIGKGVHLGCILSPCLFNFYVDHIMRNAGLDEAQAGIKTAARNINNLRYADDTTFTAESEELKSLLMKVKVESENVGLKLSIQKTKIMASGPISSVQFSRSVVSDSLPPHESQHTRPPCPSPTPGVHSDSCTLSPWCHPAICSVVPFSSCSQSLPASESFPVSQLFTWGGQSIGVSALASVLPMNTQDRSPLERTGWISLQSKGLSRVFSSNTVQKHQFFSAQLSSQSNSHIHTWPYWKNHSLD